MAQGGAIQNRSEGRLVRFAEASERQFPNVLGERYEGALSSVRSQTPPADKWTDYAGLNREPPSLQDPDFKQNMECVWRTYLSFFCTVEEFIDQNVKAVRDWMKDCGGDCGYSAFNQTTKLVKNLNAHMDTLERTVEGVESHSGLLTLVRTFRDILKETSTELRGQLGIFDKAYDKKLDSLSFA